MPNVQVGQKVIQFPDSASQEEILAAIQDYEASQMPRGVLPQATIEPAIAMAGSAVGEVAGGLSGLARTGYGLVTGEGGQEALRQGAEAVESVSGAMQRATSPRTQYGQMGMRAVGSALEPIATGIEKVSTGLGDVALDVSGSPAAAAAAYTAPAAVLEALGVGALRKLIPNTTFLDAAGNPTPELLSALRGMGLSWKDLEASAKAKIPQQAGATRTTGLPVPESKALDPVKAEQIRAGGSEASLAPLMLNRAGRATDDPLARQAIKQWDDEGLVQAVKTATPETKSAMLEMLDLRQRIQGNKRLSQTQRPSDIAGQSAVRRVEYLRDVAAENRKRLNEIAEKNLAGKAMDAAPVLETLQDSLKSLDIGVVPSDSGLPKPVFEGSMVSKNRSAQRVISDLFGLLSEGGAPDALRFHKLKRQLDEMIDYKKSMQGGLTKSGQTVLKDLRRSLNDELRRVDGEYGQVNDVLSDVLTVFDDLDSVSGRRTDIFDPDAPQKLGQEFRKLFSNYGVRSDLMSAVNSLEQVAAKYGGEFSDSTMDLAMFANALDTRFGPVAETSFKGEIASAMKGAQADDALRRSAEQGLTRTVMEKAFDAYQGARGVNTERAYGVMEALLRRGEQ